MAHWCGHATGVLFQALVLSSLQHALSTWARGQQALLLEVLPISVYLLVSSSSMLFWPW